jgi:hypothetical protein
MPVLVDGPLYQLEQVRRSTDQETFQGDQAPGEGPGGGQERSKE